ncbi:hypothetical protein AB0L99_45165 [Streptomyces sp. NPDC051954]|uniref:hypothetical protein n=1 Tax=Streptomyces sp. NPDC051954 TaxID=3155524 RepID=UPI0034256112
MLSVRTALGVGTRAVAGGLILAILIECMAWGLDTWAAAAHSGFAAHLRAEERQPLEDADLDVDTQGVIDARPGEGSGGTISVRLHDAQEDEWALTTRYQVTLRPSDPLVDTLRAHPNLIGSTVEVMPGGFVTAHLSQQFDGSYSGTPDWCAVSQDSRTGLVTITSVYTAVRTSPIDNQVFIYDLAREVKDTDHHVVPRLPGYWAWSFEAPPPWRVSVEGRPNRQIGRSVDVTLSEKRERVVVLVQFPPADEKRSPETVYYGQTSPGSRAVLSLLALLAVTVGTFASLAHGPPTRRRLRQSTVLGLVLVVCLVTALLMWNPYLGGAYALSWSYYTSSFDAFSLIDEGTPVELKIQSGFLGMALFALPLLVLCAAHALRTGAPPPQRRILAVTASAPTLVIAACLMGGGRWIWPSACCLVAAFTVSGVVFLALRFGLVGEAIRPWAAALAAVAAASTTSGIALLFVPSEFWVPPWAGPSLTQLSFRSSLASWPLTFLLLTPWTMVLVLIAGPMIPSVARLGKAARAALVLVLIALLLPWWTPFNKFVYYARPPTIPLITQLTGQMPGADFQVGVQVFAFAFQMMWLTITAFVLAHLYNSGRSGRSWAPSAPAACAVLLVLATAAPITGDPANWLPHWTTTAALITVWGGGRLLLPAERREQASRLHGLTGAAHTRLVHSLARVLLYAEGRHRFLTASRGTLAEAGGPQQNWERSWQSLRAPTASDAARETAWLRSAALGSSGGRSAWSNGLAAAVVSALLTLPWTVWPAWRGRNYSGILEALTVAGSTTGLWLAHGFTYGYLYPWIRGGGPVVKAGWLWAVMAPTQLLLLWPRLRLPFDQTALTVCLLLAQSAVMALGLALFWEVRLVHRADLLWGHVRNFRRLSSLAAPVSTVLVAAVTAVVTVLATAWAGNLTTPEGPPLPSPSVTSTPLP